MAVKNITVVENILSANDQIAAANRERLNQAGIYALNIMSSPGAGKTTLIEKTIRALQGELQIAVINGDTSAASFDAERAQNAGAGAVHVNTGGNCHLEAHMIRDALDTLELEKVNLLIVENVGNLICPSGWDLGVHKRVLIASVPEGADKPYKYPGMYQWVDALILNKIDLLPYVPFDLDFFKRGVEMLNPGLEFFPVSGLTGEGLDRWLDWLRGTVAAR